MVQRKEKECSGAHLKWELPGGKTLFGEMPEEALKREFLEETGIKIKILSLLPKIQVSVWEYPDRIQQVFVFCYVCEYIEKKSNSSDHRVNKVAWIEKNRVKNMKLLPGIREFIEYKANL